MLRSLFMLLLSFGVISVFAQLTLTVTSIPANTPANASIYVAGTFNSWNEADSNFILTPQGNGQFSITFQTAPGLVEFKFTRGSWQTVEGNASGGFIANHTLQYNGGNQTETLPILSWEGSSTSGGTTTWNTAVLDDDFYIPQLNRSRRVWIYLPPDYHTSSKYYPVVYLLDGQNVFDASTSFSGEWKVDETLNTLFDQGDYGCIAVAVDNGGADRLHEYSPWVNPQYGGGQGDEFLAFMANTLKPHIDQNFRSLNAPQYTAIVGSSMGGIFAQYALSERQDIYGKAGVLSPAFWFADDASKLHVLDKGKQADVRVDYLAGGDEPAYVTTDMNAVRDAMVQVGFSKQNETRSRTISGGEHSEWFWAQEFGSVYKWLFADFTSQTTIGNHQSDDWTLYPNPSNGIFHVDNMEQNESLEVATFSQNGSLLDRDTLEYKEDLDIQNLPRGVYFIKITNKTGQTIWQRAILAGKE